MPDDFFDAFAYSMAMNARDVWLSDQEVHRRYEDARRQAEGREQARTSDTELVDKTVLRYMASVPLKPGQMLLLGPKGVETLTTPGNGGFLNHPGDVYIVDKKVWSSKT